MTRGWLALAAAYGLVAVALGAFGAHALKARLTPEMQPVWRTAVEYHFWHTLALLAVGLLLTRAPQQTTLHWAGAGFALGILLFSGSLYALALSGARGWGAVTPVGGVLFLLGWAALLIGVLRLP